ncbi:hypothetical protein HDU93_000352 [Gonapodya sp. JEL0774]|nr:hypothetical protein HDU93_000352 [Gonapodya sp. JEL0774]
MATRRPSLFPSSKGAPSPLAPLSLADPLNLKPTLSAARHFSDPASPSTIVGVDLDGDTSSTPLSLVGLSMKFGTGAGGLVDRALDYLPTSPTTESEMETEEDRQRRELAEEEGGSMDGESDDGGMLGSVTDVHHGGQEGHGAAGGAHGLLKMAVLSNSKNKGQGSGVPQDSGSRRGSGDSSGAKDVRNKRDTNQMVWDPPPLPSQGRENGGNDQPVLAHRASNEEQDLASKDEDERDEFGRVISPTTATTLSPPEMNDVSGVSPDCVAPAPSSAPNFMVTTFPSITSNTSSPPLSASPTPNSLPTALPSTISRHNSLLPSVAAAPTTLVASLANSDHSTTARVILSISHHPSRYVAAFESSSANSVLQALCEKNTREGIRVAAEVVHIQTRERVARGSVGGGTINRSSLGGTLGLVGGTLGHRLSITSEAVGPIGGSGAAVQFGVASLPWMFYVAMLRNPDIHFSREARLALCDALLSSRLPMDVDKCLKLIASIPRDQWDRETYTRAVQVNLQKRPRDFNRAARLAADYGLTMVVVEGESRGTSRFVSTPLVAGASDQDRKNMWRLYEEGARQVKWEDSLSRYVGLRDLVQRGDSGLGGMSRRGSSTSFGAGAPGAAGWGVSMKTFSGNEKAGATGGASNSASPSQSQPARGRSTSESPPAETASPIHQQPASPPSRRSSNAGDQKNPSGNLETGSSASLQARSGKLPDLDNAMMEVCHSFGKWDKAWEIFQNMGIFDRHTPGIVVTVCRRAFNETDPQTNPETRKQWEDRAWFVYTKVLARRESLAMQDSSEYPDVLNNLRDEYLARPIFRICLSALESELSKFPGGVLGARTPPKNCVEICSKAFEIYAGVRQTFVFGNRRTKKCNLNTYAMLLDMCTKISDLPHMSIVLQDLWDAKVELEVGLLQPLQEIHDDILCGDDDECQFTDVLYHPIRRRNGSIAGSAANSARDVSAANSSGDDAAKTIRQVLPVYADHPEAKKLLKHAVKRASMLAARMQKATDVGGPGGPGGPAGKVDAAKSRGSGIRGMLGW